MAAFALDLFKILAIFALSVYSMEALIILTLFVYWYVQYRREEARRAPRS